MEYVISYLSCKKFKVNKDTTVFSITGLLQDKFKKKVAEVGMTSQFTTEQIRELKNKINTDVQYAMIDSVINQMAEFIFTLTELYYPDQKLEDIKNELLDNSKDFIAKAENKLSELLEEESITMKKKMIWKIN